MKNSFLVGFLLLSNALIAGTKVVVNTEEILAIDIGHPIGRCKGWTDISLKGGYWMCVVETPEQIAKTLKVIK